MQQAFTAVQRRLVSLLRSDPPFRPAQAGAPRAALDRWLATRLSREELHVLFRLEELYGERALAELLAEVLVEAGVVGQRLN
jgi:hypothetical protein